MHRPPRVPNEIFWYEKSKKVSDGRKKKKKRLKNYKEYIEDIKAGRIGTLDLNEDIVYKSKKSKEM